MKDTQECQAQSKHSKSSVMMMRRRMMTMGGRNPVDKYPIPHIICYLLYVKYYFELFFDSKNMYRIPYV